MALDMLRMVNIAEPERVAQSYPFEISGGMQQRAMIAIALSCGPDLLIADEPTTALDVTTQAQILRELDALIARLGTGVILISHDLGVIAEFTDRVLVMKDGEVVESGRTADIVAAPRHPYTQQLLAAVRQARGRGPGHGGDACPCCGLTMSSRTTRCAAACSAARAARLRAVDGVSLEIAEGSTFGLVGESGCGKSTLSRLVLGMETPSSGSIEAAGRDPNALGRAAMKAWRRDVQIIAQDPAGALPVRMRAARLVEEPWRIHGITPDRRPSCGARSSSCAASGSTIAMAARFRISSRAASGSAS